MIVIHTPISYGTRIEYPVTINGKDYLFYIQCKDWPTALDASIDGLVTNLSHVAICNDLEITSAGPIDELLYQNLMKLPEVYKQHHYARSYVTGHTPVDQIRLRLTLPTCKRTANTTGIAITPLSMGLDSLYTILKRKDEITHLMYIKGMDPGQIPTAVEKNMEFVANYTGKKLLIVESNFRNELQGTKLIASGIMYTGDSMLFALAYPFCPEKVVFNGVGDALYTPAIHPQHPDLNHYYFSNQLTSSDLDIDKIFKIKYLLEEHPIILEISRVCSDTVKLPTILPTVYNGNTYLRGTFNCGECSKCCRIFAMIQMLDKDHPLLHTTDYITKYLNKHYDYRKKPYSTSVIYMTKVFDAIYAIYKEEGSLQSINSYSFAFNRKELEVIRNI